MRDRHARRDSGVRSAAPDALARGLGIAALLHAAGLAVVAWLAPPSWGPASAPTLSDDAEISLLDEVELGAASAPARALPLPEAPAASSHPPPFAAPAPAAGAARAPAAASAAVAALGAIELSAGEAEDSAADGEGSAPEAAPGAPGTAPSLSLDALGVGPGNNPFLAPSGSKPAAGALGARVDHMLRGELAKHDQRLGLGPEGPAVAAVEELVMQSTTAPNTSALLLLRTDAQGQTVHVEVLEASNDSDAWAAIARDLLAALRGKKLRVPAGSGGVSMQLSVSSRNALPSGRDPGLAIDLFGKEIKAGEGKQSTRLSLLTPRVVLYKPEVLKPEQDPVKPKVGIGIMFDLASLQGDPADIAAVARRVVHAHLVSMQTHPAEHP